MLVHFWLWDGYSVLISQTHFQTLDLGKKSQQVHGKTWPTELRWWASKQHCTRIFHYCLCLPLYHMTIAALSSGILSLACQRSIWLYFKSSRGWRPEKFDCCTFMTTPTRRPWTFLSRTSLESGKLRIFRNPTSPLPPSHVPDRPVVSTFEMVTWNYLYEWIYRSVPQIRPPFCNLSLSTKRRGGLYAITPPPRSRNVERFCGCWLRSCTAFHHGDLTV